MAALSGSKLERNEFKTKASFQLRYYSVWKDAFFVNT